MLSDAVDIITAVSVSCDCNWLLSSIDLILYLAVSMVLPISDTLFKVRLCSDSNFVLNFDK